MKDQYEIGNISKIIMMAVTALLITVTGIIFKQTVLNILPLYISLIIAYLQTKVSRWAAFLGSLNSILYAIVYLYFGLYAMSVYAVLVSFTFQMLTFIRWSKSKYKQSTILKKLSPKQIAVAVVCLIIIWIVVYKVLSLFNSSYLILDNTITLIGILASVLMLFAYVEYTWLMVFSRIISMFLYIKMMKSNPAQITYLIFEIYFLTCNVLALIKALQLYKEQQSTKIENI